MGRVLLENATKFFDGNPVVSAVSLEVKDKEFIVLVGPSGCGKTTTLRMIAGLEEISEGKIFIGDRLVNEVPPKDRDIAMVFQNYALYPHMNVYDNMAFGLKLRRFPKREIDQRVNDAAEILGLKDLLKRLPKQLSGGQRQRVALGRAIVRNPSVFLMDEPLSNLDAKLRVQMRAELKRLHQRLKTTIIYVTHDQVEAMTLGERIVVMMNGKIQQADSPLVVYDRPGNRFVAGFIGSPPMNFIVGRLSRSGAAAVFESASLNIILPGDFTSALSPYLGKEVTLGIRPADVLSEKEAAYVKDGHRFEAQVDFRELMGSETYLYLKVGAHPLIARMDALFDTPSGSRLGMVLNLRKVHVFDKDTQEAIL